MGENELRVAICDKCGRSLSAPVHSDEIIEFCAQKLDEIAHKAAHEWEYSGVSVVIIKDCAATLRKLKHPSSEPAPDARLLALSTVLYDIASEPYPDGDLSAVADSYNAIRKKARKAIGWEPGKERP